jgi:hypothetical protein
VKTIEQLAREAGINFTPAGPHDDGIDTWFGDQYLPSGALQRFAALVLAEHSPGIIALARKLAIQEVLALADEELDPYEVEVLKTALASKGASQHWVESPANTIEGMRNASKGTPRPAGRTIVVHGQGPAGPTVTVDGVLYDDYKIDPAGHAYFEVPASKGETP